MNGPLYTFTHGFSSATGKPVAILLLNGNVYAHPNTSIADPPGYVTYYLDLTATGTGALGSFQMPYTPSGSWTIYVQYDYDPDGKTSLVVTFDDSGTGSSVWYIRGVEELEIAEFDFLQSSAQLTFNNTVSTGAFVSTSRWPAAVTNTTTTGPVLTNINIGMRHAPPTGGGVVRGIHGEQLISRFVIDPDLGGPADQWVMRIYSRGGESEAWTERHTESVNYGPLWTSGGNIHGYLASGTHQSTVFLGTVPRGVESYHTSGGPMLRSIDLGNDWATYSFGPGEGETYPRVTGWCDGRLSSIIAAYRPDIDDDEHISVLCAYDNLDLSSYLRASPLAPFPTNVTMKVRDAGSYEGPRAYPFVWEDEDAGVARVGVVTDGLYREWDIQNPCVVGSVASSVTLSFSESVPATFECFCYDIHTGYTGEQMLVGYSGNDQKVRTWYRTGRAGTWGEIRAEFTVLDAAMPYVNQRSDGTWEVGWLNGTGWLIATTGNPAADESGWDIPT